MDLEKSSDIKYFRYMDDVRIFTKSREDARRCILELARTLRSLHLNVQTAKTRIFDESIGEVTRLLIDDRVDTLSEMIDEIQKEYKGKGVPEKNKRSYMRALSDIAKKKQPQAKR